MSLMVNAIHVIASFERIQKLKSKRNNSEREKKHKRFHLIRRRKKNSRMEIEPAVNAANFAVDDFPQPSGPINNTWPLHNNKHRQQRKIHKFHQFNSSFLLVASTFCAFKCNTAPSIYKYNTLLLMAYL